MKKSFAIGLLLAGALTVPACAQSGLKVIARMTPAGSPLKDHGFDIGVVDQAAHRYYLADSGNAGVDVFDTQLNKYIGRVEGFAGLKKGDVGGPNGVSVVDGQIWGSDGDSTVKIADPKTFKVLKSVSTGGKKRADESAYDSKDHIFAVVNGADEPPFITFISTGDDPKVLAKLPFEHATDGLEQPLYDAATGYFYVVVPQLDKNKTLGAAAQIDPKTFKVVKMMNIENCTPTGLAPGAGGNLFIGCHNFKKPPQLSGVLNPTTGEFTRIPGVGGGDEITYNSSLGLYFVAANHFPSGPVLGVIDAKTNKWIENVPTSEASHSVATDGLTDRVYVPADSSGKICNGCVAVFGTK